jgi:hypothetical protein
MARNTYSVTSLDSLLAALGGFAETEAHPRDVWRQRLKTLWARPIVTDEIAEMLGTTGGNIRTHAHLMGLPARRPCKRGAHP